MASKKKEKLLEFGTWEALKTTGNPPPARYGHGCAMLGSRLYWFGGASSNEDDSTTYYGDLFVLDLAESPRCWKLVAQKGDIPSAREGCILCAVGEELFLYGGVDKEGSYTCAEGLYVFKTTTNEWERRATNGPAPQSQSMSAVVIDNKLVTFGGVLNGVAQNSTHLLDIATMKWSVVETSGTKPPPRCDHGSSVIGRKMYVSSGSGGESVWFNDVFSLDLSTNKWAKVDIEGNPPTPRDYVTVVTLSNMYLIQYGGYSDDRCFSDLHYVDLSSQKPEWRQLVGEPSPPARYGHSAVVHDNTLYVCAGQDMDQELNDVWALSLKAPLVGFEPTPVPRSRYTTTTPVPAPRKTITPTLPQAAKPRDFEELRTSYVKRINEMFDTLSDKFQQLDNAIATLESERAAFEAEKKAHCELYERQQQELKEMLNNHKTQNEEWVEKIRTENDSERRQLAEERADVERASAELAREQEAFQVKSKKLDAIMRQVQGLNV